MNILIEFSNSTGLQVKYHQTTLAPINVDSIHPENLNFSFGCKIERLPFTYLGLPLGTTRHSVADLIPLVSRLDRRLFGISSPISYTVRLTLLNSVISAMPMYAMWSIKVPIKFLVHLKKLEHNYLETETNMVNVRLIGN
jgi:hypothetical protein